MKMDHDMDQITEVKLRRKDQKNTASQIYFPEAQYQDFLNGKRDVSDYGATADQGIEHITHITGTVSSIVNEKCFVQDEAGFTVGYYIGHGNIGDKVRCQAIREFGRGGGYYKLEPISVLEYGPTQYREGDPLVGVVFKTDDTRCFVKTSEGVIGAYAGDNRVGDRVLCTLESNGAVENGIQIRDLKLDTVLVKAPVIDYKKHDRFEGAIIQKDGDTVYVKTSDDFIGFYNGEGQVGDRVICTVKRSVKDPQYDRCYSLDLKRIVRPRLNEHAA